MVALIGWPGGEGAESQVLEIVGLELAEREREKKTLA